MSETLVGASSAGRDGQWLLIGDRQPVSFKRDYFAWMVGQHPQALQAQIEQNLRADSAFMLQEPLPRDVLIELPTSVIEHARHLARPGRRLLQTKASAGVVQIDEYTAVFAHDRLEGSRDDFVAIAGAGAENVSRQAV